MTMKLNKHGGLITDDDSGLIHLQATSNGGNYSTFLNEDGTPYAAGFGKKFKAVRVVHSHDLAGARFSIGYGDTNVQFAAVAPTNFKGSYSYALSSTAAFKLEDVPWHQLFPTGKYPCIKLPANADTAYVDMWGYEV